MSQIGPSPEENAWAYAKPDASPHGRVRRRVLSLLKRFGYAGARVAGEVITLFRQ